LIATVEPSAKLNLISCLRGGHVAVQGRPIFQLDEIIDKRSYFFSEIKKFKNKKVVLGGLPDHILKWLIYLDGMAKCIILLPQDFDKNLSKLIHDAIKPDLSIYDSNEIKIKSSQTVLINPDLQWIHNNSHGEIVHPLESEWILATSGTTNTPKLVSHTFDSLTNKITKDPRYFDLTWGLIYDPARFAGLQILLQGITNSRKLIIPNPQASLIDKINFLINEKCSALAATPTLWRKILLCPNAAKLQLKQISLGGEIVGKSILETLQKVYPHSHITHIYASTEAGVGFAVHDKLPGFPSDWLSSGVKNTNLSISNEGTLLIRHNKITQQYIGSQEKITGDDGWIDTGDLIQIISTRAHFIGRRNGSINIGGNKVMPEEIEEFILNFPEVSGVLVRGRHSSLMGSLLEALITVKNAGLDNSALIKAIRSRCISHFPPHKRPAFITIYEELPSSSSSGKIKRESTNE
jgi:acyl-CoA synthetase (AMP-forming)/AMP-acid ligase II